MWSSAGQASDDRLFMDLFQASCAYLLLSPFPTGSKHVQFVSNFNKYNILNLIMDEICPLSPQIAPLLRTSILFLEICNHQHIFITLFDYIGFQAFISLTASNSQVNQAVNTHEGVQVRLLRRKIDKLKQKEIQRQFANILWVDFNFFNPFTLPPYQKDLVEASSIDDADQLLRENALMTQKLYSNDLSIKRVWGKWKAEKKAQAIIGPKSRGKKKNQLKQSKFLVKPDNILEQKLKSVQKAEQILKIQMEMRNKILEQYPKAKNELEKIRNRHFAEKILDEKLPIDQKQVKYSSTRQVKVHSPISPVHKVERPANTLKQDAAWEFCVKQIVVNQIQKKKVREDLLWQPISKTMEAVKMLKNSLKNFMIPPPN